MGRRFRRDTEPADLYALFANPVLAEGLLDRLLNSAHTLTLLGRSYRCRQRPREQVATG